MDELISPYSSSACFFSHAGHHTHPVIELSSYDFPEQWLLGEDEGQEMTWPVGQCTVPEASLLADAAAYIAELRARVARLQAEARRAIRHEPPVGGGGAAMEEAVEVRMVRPNAAVVRARSTAPHAAARLMGAFRALDLRVQHACVSRVNGVAVQDAVVEVPAEVHEDALCSSLLLQMSLQDSS
ncbi:hypothetical protein QOZ80_9BG0716040 [Eleusine coracana subsp. coracana]|nr:hypothetical protein QOZ80_9BG0716040 [Eleusine coracana subsp. coracana]